MSAQIYATKQASKITQRARQEAYDTMDAATESTMNKAYEASQRARRLLSELKDI